MVGGSIPSRPVTLLIEAVMQKLMQYLKDVRSEMLKVSWPTWNELTGATVLVIILSVIMALFVFFCDRLLSEIMKLLLQTT